MAFGLRRRILKRVYPIPLAKYEIKKGLKGYRKKSTAQKYGKPLDCRGADHYHIYMTLRCRLKCEFCINRLLTNDQLPDYTERDWTEWAGFLNRLYNIRELYFNGGEHFIFPGFVDLINSLDGYNIIIFSNHELYRGNHYIAETFSA